MAENYKDNEKSGVMQTVIEKRSISRRKNVLIRYKNVQSKVAQRYEEGNQSKSKAQAYRQIKDIHGLSERTFWRIMGTNVNEEMEKLNNGQLSFNFAI